MLQLIENDLPSAVIKVIGVGGGGGNAVAAMMQSTLEGVEFIVANTDAQALKKTGVPNILQLGTGVTKGLGAGSNPEVGRQAALEDRERLTEMLKGAGGSANRERSGHFDRCSGNAAICIRRHQASNHGAKRY